VIAGGNQDSEKRAIGFLRGLVVAEDHMRTRGFIDTDNDQVGSAATLAELSGLLPLRNARPMDVFPVYLKPEQHVQDAEASVVVQGAYVYKLCLPKAGGGWNAGSSTTDLDEEAGERSFSAYGWPKSFTAGSPHKVFFVDAFERILIYQPQGQAPLRYQGTSGGPECGTEAEHPADWVRWKDKTARKSLPGDNLAAGAVDR